MRKVGIYAIAIGVALTLAAVSPAATDKFSGTGTTDNVAEISLRVVKSDGKRKIRSVVVNKLEYQTDTYCGSDGRTPRIKVTGTFNVRSNGKFRIIAQAPTGLGELRISKGKLFAKRAKGNMRFTFGKDGCRTTDTPWRARD